MISSPKNIRAPLGVSARDLLTYFDIDISKLKC